MKFIETILKGSYVIELEPYKDERGMFSRTFCSKEFKKYNLKNNMVQSNLSISYKKDTLRGMHYQVDGSEESKLVRCIKGKILDVIIDIRKDSSTFSKYVSLELSDDNNLMIYVPEGFAHGFLTLHDNCHVFYQVSNYYSPENERGIRWSDPFFNINWPVTNPIISYKDKNYKDFKV